MSLVHIDRIVDTICQTITAKENFEELCGDLLAIRIITQNDVAIPASILAELKVALKFVYERFKDDFTALEGKNQPVLMCANPNNV